MLFHVDDVFMADKPETLKNTKENTKEKFNISESRKVKKFLGVYYKWGCKRTMDKYVKKIVEGYEKYNGSDTKAQKNPGDPVTAVRKSDSEEP